MNQWLILHEIPNKLIIEWQISSTNNKSHVTVITITAVILLSKFMVPTKQSECKLAVL